jgi:biopolymer transport protein ExbB/TolQ
MGPVPSIAGVVSEGGPILLPIAALFLAGVAIAVERALAIAAAGRGVPRGLVHEAVARIEHGGAASASDLCRGLPALVPSTLARVLREAATTDGPLGADRLRERSEESISLGAIRLSRRLDLLSTAANVSTLAGLLVTVLGLRGALGAGLSGGAGASAVMGAGVSQALVATGFGIAAAIPLLLAQTYLRGRIDALVSDARAASSEVIDALVKERRVGEAAKRAMAEGRARRLRERRGADETPREKTRDKAREHEHESIVP